MTHNLICNACGWVHFKVARKYAESQVAAFSLYFNSLTKEEQDRHYGGKPSSIKDYESCMRCNNSYKNFRDAKESEVPYGSTLNPIINPEE